MKPKKIGKVTTVDMNTGEVIAEERNAMTLIPPGGDVCADCGVDHPWDQPHNQQSMYYQMQFHAKNGRWPTWSDAMSHCPDAVKAAWREHLRDVMAEDGVEIPDDLKDDRPATPRGA